MLDISDESNSGLLSTVTHSGRVQGLTFLCAVVNFRSLSIIYSTRVSFSVTGFSEGFPPSSTSVSHSVLPSNLKE
jgi:hypothetical protein